MIKRIFSVLQKKEKQNFYFIIFLMVIGAALELSSIMFAYIVLKLFVNLDTNFSNNYLLDFLNNFNLVTLGDYVKFFSISLLVIYLIKFFYFIYLYYKQTYFAYYVKSLISVNLFKIYLKKTYNFYIKKKFGRTHQKYKR